MISLTQSHWEGKDETPEPNANDESYKREGFLQEMSKVNQNDFFGIADTLGDAIFVNHS